MSGEGYYLDELIKDDKLRSLVNVVKRILQNIDSIVSMYQKPIYVESFAVPSILLRAGWQSFFSPSPVNSCSSTQHDRVASNPETSRKTLLTPLKRNPSVSSIPRKRLHLDSTNHEASLNETTIPEKQFTPVKIRNASDHEIQAQRRLLVDNTDGEVIQIGITSPILSAADQERLPHKTRRKQLTPVRVIENATEDLSFQLQHLPFPHYEGDNVETLNFEANNPVRQRTGPISPREIDREISSEVDQNCVTSIAQSVGIASNLEAEKRKSVEITEICAIFPVDGKVSSSPDKEVKGFVVPTTGYEKNTSLQDKAKAGNNGKFISPNEEIRRIAKPGYLKENYFTPVKRTKMPVDPTTNVQKYISSDEKAEMEICSDQDSKLGISSNQGSKVNDIFAAKRKKPSPRINQFRFVPKIVQSAQVAEVETDVSCELIDKPSPTTIPIPFADCNRLTNSKDKKRSPKEAHLFLDSKAGNSKDFSSSAKSPLTRSPIEAKTNNRSRYDISFGKDRLSCEPPKERPPTKSSLEAASSPIINDRDLKTDDCVMRFFTLLTLREINLGKFFNNLLEFHWDLKRLYSLIGDMQIVVQQMLLYKDCNSKELQECFVRLLAETSKLVEKSGSWKMDVDLEIPSFTNHFKLIKRIKTFIATLNPDIQHVPMELLRAHEKDSNAKWEKIDEMILIINSRIPLFLSTGVDLGTLTNLFFKLLIILEILKPSPIPTP